MSSDGGKNWQAIDFGKRDNDYYINAIVGAADASVVYVGASTGLWVDHSGAWSEIAYPVGMSHAIDAVAASANGMVVVVASHDVSGHASLWISEDMGKSWSNLRPID